MGKNGKTPHAQELPDRVYDHGTPELRQHCMILQTAKRSYVLTQLPLDFYYFSRRCISTRQYDAGKRLMEAFDRSGAMKSSSPVANLESSGIRGGAPAHLEGNHQARQEIRRALRKMGKEEGLIVLNVVCYGYALNEPEMPAGSNKTKMARFKRGLSRLANYYRMP